MSEKIENKMFLNFGDESIEVEEELEDGRIHVLFSVCCSNKFDSEEKTMSEKVESKKIIGFNKDSIELGEQLKDGSFRRERKLDLTGKDVVIFSGPSGTGKTRTLDFMRKIEGNFCIDEVDNEEFCSDSLSNLLKGLFSERKNGLTYCKRVIIATQVKPDDIKSQVFSFMDMAAKKNKILFIEITE